MSGLDHRKKVVGIIQARMGSTRFPEKMMAPFKGYSLIVWVLRRVMRAQELDHVVLAIPDTVQNEILAQVAAGLGIKIFRGFEQDVLSRFVEAAKSTGAPDMIVRICADNPLIAPEEIDRLVGFFRGSDFDYAYNHIPTDIYQCPDGLGAEIMRAQVLYNVADLVHEQKYREHVTLYIREHPDKFLIGVPPIPQLLQGLTDVKLDVDTVDDLAKLELLPATLTPETSLAELIAYVK
ncbi:MAG: spore coat biosynthesis protein F [bacterium]|nr:spore coat biosynthesis protein F [bacterium]